MNPDRLERMAETGYIVLILAVAVLLWFEAGRLPPAPYDPLGPGAFPRWVSYGLGALGLAMIVRRILGASLGRASQSMVTGLDGEAEHVLSPGTAVSMLVLSFAYAGLLSFRAIPFMVATALFLFAAGAVLGPLERRRLLVVAIFAVVAAITLDYLFRTIFSLDLS